jgi:hypothetical protein
MEDAVINAMKQVFAEDIRMVDHTFKVLAYARHIAEGESAGPELQQTVISASRKPCVNTGPRPRPIKKKKAAPLPEPYCRSSVSPEQWSTGSALS